MEEGEEASDNNDKDDKDDKDNPNDTPTQSMRPRIHHDTRYFHQIARYLKAKLAEHQIENRMKEDALNYELKEGTLYYRDTGIQVVMDKDLFSQIVEAVHKDLGHYGKKTTLDGVAEWYIVATDIWRDGQGQLDACMPCQLYKPIPASSAKRTARIRPNENKQAFNPR